MRFLTKGLQSTIQDLGRPSMKQFGVNSSGVMDWKSFSLLNYLLSNNENEACIEIHFPAPIILFEESCVFAITGANFEPTLNNIELSNNKQYAASIGDILRFEYKKDGERAYFGVKRGFLLDDWLGSKSSNLFLKKLLLPDEIKVKDINSICLKRGLGRNFGLQNSDSISFVASPSFENLSHVNKSAFLSQKYKISSQSNRMACKLEGQPLEQLETNEMISSAVAFGTIQLLPNGLPLVLMADAQTTGGYPVLGFVIKTDLPVLAQLSPNKTVRFKKVSLDFAFASYKTLISEFVILKSTLNFLENGN